VSVRPSTAQSATQSATMSETPTATLSGASRGSCALNASQPTVGVVIAAGMPAACVAKAGGQNQLMSKTAKVRKIRQKEKHPLPHLKWSWVNIIGSRAFSLANTLGSLKFLDSATCCRLLATSATMASAEGEQGKETLARRLTSNSRSAPSITTLPPHLAVSTIKRRWGQRPRRRRRAP
jgi:hypothetical protein